MLHHFELNVTQEREMFSFITLKENAVIRKTQNVISLSCETTGRK